MFELMTIVVNGRKQKRFSRKLLYNKRSAFTRLGSRTFLVITGINLFISKRGSAAPTQPKHWAIPDTTYPRNKFCHHSLKQACSYV